MWWSGGGRHLRCAVTNEAYPGLWLEYLLRAGGLVGRTSRSCSDFKVGRSERSGRGGADAEKSPEEQVT